MSVQTQNGYPATSWHLEARRINQTLQSIAYDGGLRTQIPVNLRQSGFLSDLMLTARLNSVFTTAGPPSVDALGNYGALINRILIRTQNLGELWNVSGEGTKLINFIEKHYRHGSRNILNPVYDNIPASPGTSAFTLTYGYHLPIATLLANSFSPVGLYQLAIQDQVVEMDISFNPLLGTTGNVGQGVYVPGTAVQGTTTGGVSIQQAGFRPVRNPNGYPDLGRLHRWRETWVPFSADGPVDIPLIPGNFYGRIIYWVIINGAAAATNNATNVVTNLYFTYGGDTSPYQETGDAVLQRQGEEYDVQLPAGVLVHDWLQNTHTDRDFLNSRVVTAPHATLNISGGSYGGQRTGVKVIMEEYAPIVWNAGVPALASGAR